MMVLLDDGGLRIFDSPDHPPDWIEAIDVENGEYQFCDDKGQRYVGVITKPTRNCSGFILQPDGTADPVNCRQLLDAAVYVEPNPKFPDLETLRKHVR